MSSFNMCFRIFSISFFAICIIFFIGEQRIESRNYELEIKRLEREIAELEELKQKLTMQYNNEYINFAKSSTSSRSKPISINDIKLIEIEKSSTQNKIEDMKSRKISDFEKFISLIKNKLS